MFTQEQKQKIALALAEKNLGPCPACRRGQTWSVGEGLVMFPFQQKTVLGYIAGRQSYPCVPLICSYCGNTTFHNAFTLGLADLLGLTPVPGASREEVTPHG